MNEDLHDERFSEDPDEQLRIENDILKLKIQAELGGDFQGEADLPPEVENTFLKNVLEFEHKQANAEIKTLYEILKRPNIIEHYSLNDSDLINALHQLEALMEDNGIVVDYADEYSPRIKYRFITEELLKKEAPHIDLPGMTMHYIYEEFHPNHPIAIEQLTKAFFESWMNQTLGENSIELAHDFILEDGSMMSSKSVIDKVQMVFDAYESFHHSDYSIDTVSYELHETGTGLGFSEGQISYSAILENGEKQFYDGHFKLFIQYDGFWSIFYFEWPGFNWD